MKKTLIFLLSTALVPAMAADLATKAPYAPVASPIYNWTGMYIGANAGGGWGSNCWTQRGYDVPFGATNAGFSGAIAAGGNPGVTEGCNSGNGAIVGGQIGARYQMNNIVFGIELQGDWANFSGGNASAAVGGINTLFGPGTVSTLTNQTKTDAIGMFTGQIGYSFGSVLWYAKGGAAVTDNSYNGTLNVAVPAGVLAPGAATLTAMDHGTDVKFGGVVGTGVEWRFAPGWSIGAEYNHLFMGSQQVGLAYTGGTTTVPAFAIGVPGAPSRNESISQDIDLATIRLNYQINWPH
jgi:outer membrane immunogenic protein